jgi:hypothetical protein
LDYCSEVSLICKVLKLTPKEYANDLTFPPEIIQEAARAAADVIIHHNTVSLI